MDKISLGDARTELGKLSVRAQHAHQPTVFTRNGNDESVLIGIDDYRKLLWHGVSEAGRQQILRDHEAVLRGEEIPGSLSFEEVQARLAESDQ